MKTYQICAVAFAAVLVVSCTRAPQSAATAEPRTFLKIGNTYRITTAPAGDAAGVPGNVVKVREHVGGGWCRVECFVVIIRDGKRMLTRRSDSSWINMAHVISATEEAAMDELSPNAS